ncbi:MAG TPA: M1 family aminopeptidase, partial [Kofleriaceae bacterium]|nr:M1 family aminopeptidase [Kofleriaceae bacterium]
MSSRGLAAAVLVLAACGCRLGPSAAPPLPRPPAPAPAPAPVVTDDGPPVGRLDDRARPVAASIELEVDPRAPDVGGRVTIDVAIGRPLRVVWLNGRGLTIAAARIVDGGRTQVARVIGDPLAAADHTDGQGELIGLAVDQPLLPGAARVEIDYRAAWGSDGGLLHSTEIGPMAVTDLSPDDARSVMPCFDDPRFKLPWTLALIVPTGMAAFANYPERARHPVDAGHDRVEFQPTRPLPVHLLAFTVGALVTIDGGTEPVPTRVITVAGTEAAMAHAASQLPGLLAELSAYVEEPVPFPKLDVVAVPTLSGSVVGMENPGLVTVRADSLEVAAGAPPWVAEAVTSTLAHELSHLWFGDLVSLAWWDEFWLNEGFATWLTDKLMAAREPTWSLVGHPFAPWLMMAQDPPGSSPVRKPLRALADFPQILDLKAYARGAAVVATFEAWLGPARFRDVVHGWIAQHRDGSVTTSMLVDALAAAAPADPAGGIVADRPAVAATMAGLVDHAGVPTARFALRCDAGGPARVDVAVDHGPAAAPWP